MVLDFNSQEFKTEERKPFYNDKGGILENVYMVSAGMNEAGDRLEILYDYDGTLISDSINVIKSTTGNVISINVKNDIFSIFTPR
jgi:hypothetical protein